MKKVELSQNMRMKKPNTENSPVVYSNLPRRSGTPFNYSPSERKFLSECFGIPEFFTPAQRLPLGEQMTNQKQPYMQKLRPSAEVYHNLTGKAWSPLWDVAEYEHHYVVTVELPGVRSDDVTVEFSERKMIVMGKRLAPSWGMMSSDLEDSDPVYLRKEIKEGPFHFVWQIPKFVNTLDSSFELVDGFLYISLAKHIPPRPKF